MIREAELEVDNSCILGQGSIGVVVEGRFCCGPVAIKLLETSQLDESRIAAFNELRILRHIRHPNIVHFYGACFCSAAACSSGMVWKASTSYPLGWAKNL